MSGVVDSTADWGITSPFEISYVTYCTLILENQCGSEIMHPLNDRFACDRVDWTHDGL